MNNVIFSSASDEWATPQNVYDQLNAEFHFNLDPCATHENHKCNRYFTKEQNGLNQWWGVGTVAFVNPPYSEISAWVKKCYYESLNPKSIVVMLIPARTDTKYFHDYIYNRSEIRFLKGRLKFGDSKNPAPFPSMVVIFRSAGV